MFASVVSSQYSQYSQFLANYANSQNQKNSDVYKSLRKNYFDKESSALQKNELKCNPFPEGVD